MCALLIKIGGLQPVKKDTPAVNKIFNSIKIGEFETLKDGGCLIKSSQNRKLAYDKKSINCAISLWNLVKIINSAKNCGFFTISKFFILGTFLWNTLYLKSVVTLFINQVPIAVCFMAWELGNTFKVFFWLCLFDRKGKPCQHKTLLPK